MVEYNLGDIYEPRRTGHVARIIAERADYGDFRLKEFPDEAGTMGYQVYVGKEPEMYHVMTIIPLGEETGDGMYTKFAVQVTHLGEKKVTENILKEVQAELGGQ